MEKGVEEAEGPESELVEDGPVSEAKAGFDCTMSLEVPKDAAPASDLEAETFDEGAESFIPKNRLPESCDVPDVDGDAKEAGVGDDIICLKMVEVADDELVLVAWKADWVVTVLGGWIVVEILLFSVLPDGIPEFADSDESPSVLAFLDPFS